MALKLNVNTPTQKLKLIPNVYVFNPSNVSIFKATKYLLMLYVISSSVSTKILSINEGLNDMVNKHVIKPIIKTSITNFTSNEL